MRLLSAIASQVYSTWEAGGLIKPRYKSAGGQHLWPGGCMGICRRWSRGPVWLVGKRKEEDIAENDVQCQTTAEQRFHDCLSICLGCNAHQKVSWQQREEGKAREEDVTVLTSGIWGLCQKTESQWGLSNCVPAGPATSCSHQPSPSSVFRLRMMSTCTVEHFPFPPFNSSPPGEKVGIKACSCLITSLNYQLNNAWTLIHRADWWLPLLTLFYFYCLARASSFKSWIIRTETLRYSSQINPWPIDILLYLTNHTTSFFPDNFSINCFSDLIRYKVRLWLGFYIPISDKLSWSPNQLRLGF